MMDVQLSNWWLAPVRALAQLQTWLRGRLPPWLVATLVAIAVAAAVIGMHRLRLLEAAELATYDAFLRTRATLLDTGPDPRVLLVTITERDIQEQGTWPLSDGVLARTIQALGALGPRAIGLDIYRDVPVPPGSAQLDQVLRQDRRVIVVTKFAEGSSSGVRPPAVLKGTEQVAFNDVVGRPRGHGAADPDLPRRRADRHVLIRPPPSLALPREGTGGPRSRPCRRDARAAWADNTPAARSQRRAV